MKRKAQRPLKKLCNGQLHLIAVKLNSEQISMLDNEVEKQSTTFEVRATRSSVMRQALIELVQRRAS